MTRLVLLIVVIVFAGCAREVRLEDAEGAWHIRGNILITTDSGRHMLQMEMYGQRENFWVLEGKSPLISARIFWFLAKNGGTNYLINDIHKTHWFFVDGEFNSLFLEVLPLFFVQGERNLTNASWQNGWVASYKHQNWSVTVTRRFPDGRPRIMVMEENNNAQKIIFDLLKIEQGLYHIPAYAHLPWQEVTITSAGDIWEVVYE